MDALDLLDLIQKGESSTVQFKIRINDAYKIGTEMVAFSNTKGGLMIIGINDKAKTVSLGLRLNIKIVTTTSKKMARTTSII